MTLNSVTATVEQIRAKVEQEKAQRLAQENTEKATTAKKAEIETNRDLAKSAVAALKKSIEEQAAASKKSVEEQGKYVDEELAKQLQSLLPPRMRVNLDLTPVVEASKASLRTVGFGLGKVANLFNGITAEVKKGIKQA